MKEIVVPDIILATHNKHKAQEFAQMLGGHFNVYTMEEFGVTEDIVEDGETIEENADIKVHHLFYKLKDRLERPTIFMADDTGLFVDYLNGDPGVYSARYAGEDVSYKDNNIKLLNALQGVAPEDRTAQFKTSLAVITPEFQHFNVTASVDGQIAEEETGSDGFGYDPVFIESSTGKTYAQMSSDEKNEHSHRRKALEEAKVFLESWMVSE